MAKKDVMTPGAYGGGQSSKKKNDSFSLGELLDSIIGKQQERTEAERRNEDFSRAFRSMLASPTEYTRWADDKYQRESAESKRINEAEAMRQGYEDRIRDQEEALARYEPPPPMRNLYDPHEGADGAPSVGFGLGLDDYLKEYRNEVYKPRTSIRSLGPEAQESFYLNNAALAGAIAGMTSPFESIPDREIEELERLNAMADETRLTDEDIEEFKRKHKLLEYR